jgi:hypothetical protein
VGQAIFQAKPFSHTIPHILNRSHTLYLLAYEDGTECSETLAFKLQTPEKTPEESIRQTFINLHESFYAGNQCKMLCYSQANIFIVPVY